MVDDPETFEYRQEAQICESTPSNLRDLERRRWESLERLYAKFRHGGASPRRTYLQIAHRYADVDEGYGSLGDE
jgi:hypothetical protein